MNTRLMPAFKPARSPFERVYASMATSAGAAPTWAESSISWLQINHPHFTVGLRKRDEVSTRLLKCLRKMSFAHPHHVGQDDVSSYDEDLEVRSLAWDKSDHAEMIAFMAAGGFKDKRDAAKHVDPRLAIEDDEGEVGLETLEVHESTDPAAHALRPAVPDELQELNAAIEAEELKSDSRFGAW